MVDRHTRGRCVSGRTGEANEGSRISVDTNGLEFSLVNLSRKASYLVGLLAVYIVADFLLTPLGGLETRPVADVTSTGIATLGLLFTGLALNIICLVLILRHYRRAPIFGMIGSLLYFPAAIADQTGQFSSLTPPTGITYVELIEAFVAIAIIGLGTLALREKLETPTKHV